MTGRPVLAVDVGGTKLAVALVDPAGRPTLRRELATPVGADAESVWRVLAAEVRDLAAHAPAGLAGVGVGCGGPMRWPAGEVSPINLPGWRGFPLRQRLAELLPGAGPVRLHNDAVCFTVGEHWRGAGRGRRSLLGMVVSTGVGGGLVVDGRLVDGPSGNAGHVGHVVVDPAGPTCGCGGRGCLEAVARGPAVLAWARSHGWAAPPEATGRDLAADAAGGDAVARAALTRAGTAVGVAVASVAALLDLELVVVGGGLASAGALLFDPLRESVARHARLAFTRTIRVVPAGMGRDAGVVGAAGLVLAGERYWNGD